MIIEHFTGKEVGIQNGRKYFGTFLGHRSQAEEAAREVGDQVEDYGLQVDHINSEGEMTETSQVAGSSVWK